jgi:hypothetical protein
VNLIEAENAALVTAPGWSVASGSTVHGGEELQGNATISLSFSFTGSGLTVYYESGPTTGTFTVSIDGASPIAVNTNTGASSGFAVQQPAVVTSAGGLTFGKHAVTLTCTTEWCGIDYFGISCN